MRSDELTAIIGGADAGCYEDRVEVNAVHYYYRAGLDESVADRLVDAIVEYYKTAIDNVWRACLEQ